MPPVSWPWRATRSWFTAGTRRAASGSSSLRRRTSPTVCSGGSSPGRHAASPPGKPCSGRTDARISKANQDGPVPTGSGIARRSTNGTARFRKGTTESRRLPPPRFGINRSRLRAVGRQRVRDRDGERRTASRYLEARARVCVVDLPHTIGALRSPADATVTASEPTDRCRNASRRAWSRRPNIASRHSVSEGHPRVAAHGRLARGPSRSSCRADPSLCAGPERTAESPAVFRSEQYVALAKGSRTGPTPSAGVSETRRYRTLGDVVIPAIIGQGSRRSVRVGAALTGPVDRGAALASGRRVSFEPMPSRR